MVGKTRLGRRRRDRKSDRVRRLLFAVPRGYSIKADQESDKSCVLVVLGGKPIFYAG